MFAGSRRAFLSHNYFRLAVIGVAVTPPDGKDRKADEKYQSWHQHVVEIARDCGQTYHSDQYDKDRGKAAERNDDGPDYTKAQDGPIVHRLIRPLRVQDNPPW